MEDPLANDFFEAAADFDADRIGKMAGGGMNELRGHDRLALAVERPDIGLSIGVVGADDESDGLVCDKGIAPGWGEADRCWE